MLKFFRSLRQKLIEENVRSGVLQEQNQSGALTERTAKRVGRLNRYLIYAIGEILLVMIGILLALQVNNRNEFRKTKKLNRSHLLSIKKDLKLDLEQITSNEDYLNSYEQAGIDVRDFIDRKKVKIDTIQMGRNFMRLQLFREFSPTKTAYENLLSNGGISHITNENIPRLLASYHFENPFTKRSKDQRSRLANNYDPYRIKYVQSGMLRAYLKEQIYGDTILDSLDYKVDWDNLRKDEEYRYLLDQILAMRVPARWRLEVAIQEINELRSEIDLEINIKEK